MWHSTGDLFKSPLRLKGQLQSTRGPRVLMTSALGFDQDIVGHLRETVDERVAHRLPTQQQQ